MLIKILGTGCPNCKRLEANTKEAVQQLGVDATIDKVTDVKQIVKYGVMKTPALVIDEEVKSTGKVLKVDEIKKLLSSCLFNK
ncbi:MAG TPA: thioredoxin family protein [Thermoanaerobacterales bacterium]|nr:thioredoxin family protein [Thermoanaerobacterales bacterium]